MRRLAVQLAARRLGPYQVCRPASNAAPRVALDILAMKKSFIKSSKAVFCHRNIGSFSVGTSVKAFHFETPGQPGNSDVIGETDFDPVAANFISVVGNVGNDPELRFLDNGNKVTSWSLAFRDRRDAETEWFSVEAWGPLAERAAAEIRRGNRIAVQGRLKIRSWTSPQGQPRKDVKITANSIKRIRPSSMEGWQAQPAAESAGGLRQQEDAGAYAKAANDAISNQPLQGSQPQETQQMGLTTNEELWMNFFEDTAGWYDNRSQKASGKINPKSPDFKRREGGRDAPALWIDSRTTPAWVKKELEKLDKIADGMPPF